MIRALENADLEPLDFVAPDDFRVWRRQRLPVETIRKGERVEFAPAVDMPGGTTWRLNGWAYYGEEARAMHGMLKAIANGLYYTVPE